MYNESDEEDFNLESINQMRLLMKAAIGILLDEKSVDEFLQWAQKSTPVLAPNLLEGFEGEEHRNRPLLPLPLENTAFTPSPPEK